MSKTEKDVALPNNSLSDEETRRISQTTIQNSPRKLGENDASGYNSKAQAEKMIRIMAELG